MEDEDTVERQQFDQIVKSFGQPATRRATARGLAVGALGILLTRGMTEGAAAQTCRRRGKPCQLDTECCSGECRHDVCRRHRERERERERD
jgi:hypothetical protein